MTRSTHRITNSNSRLLRKTGHPSCRIGSRPIVAYSKRGRWSQRMPILTPVLYLPPRNFVVARTSSTVWRFTVEVSPPRNHWGKVGAADSLPMGQQAVVWHTSRVEEVRHLARHELRRCSSKHTQPLRGRVRMDLSSSPSVDQ